MQLPGQDACDPPMEECHPSIRPMPAYFNRGGMKIRLQAKHRYEPPCKAARTLATASALTGGA
jgi:hypothetical protein